MFAAVFVKVLVRRNNVVNVGWVGLGWVTPALGLSRQCSLAQRDFPASTAQQAVGRMSNVKQPVLAMIYTCALCRSQTGHVWPWFTRTS